MSKPKQKVKAAATEGKGDVYVAFVLGEKEQKLIESFSKAEMFQWAANKINGQQKGKNRETR